MSEVKFLKMVNGLPKEMDSAADQVTLNSFSVQSGGPVLSGSGLNLSNNKIINLADAVDAGDAVNKGQLDAAIAGIDVDFAFAQEVFVAKNGNDSTGDGSLGKPFLTVTAAMNSILDATPSKRYVIRVASGFYTETSPFAIKANVFIVGEGRQSVRITAAQFTMNADFNQPSSQDCRSGYAFCTINGAADFNWQTVTSPAGKLYFHDVQFLSTVNMYGHNNAIAQSQFDSCVFFNTLTISGINVGVYTNNINYGNITLNQHPNGGMASILNAVGGYCGGTVRLNAATNDFGRRCSAFLRSFWSENLIIDGPAAYADADFNSTSKQGAQKLNGGNLIPLVSKIPFDIETQMIRPLSNNAHNLGDWGRQWFFNFNYVNGSSGTDLYLISTMGSYDPAGDTSGRNLFINSDAYGLQSNVNGGNIELETAAVSGTGVRGKVQIKARELDMTSVKITNLADGTDANDAVNKSQLDGVSSLLANKLDLAGGTMSGNIDMDSSSIINLATPVNPDDAANKQYVDDQIAGIVAVNHLEIEFTAEVAINNRDVVYISSGNNVSPAQADDINTALCIGVAQGSASAGNTVKVRVEGVISGLSSLTPGTRYYLDPANPGAITSTVPSAPGDVVFQVGIAKDSSALLIQKQFMYIVA